MWLGRIGLRKLGVNAHVGRPSDGLSDLILHCLLLPLMMKVLTSFLVMVVMFILRAVGVVVRKGRPLI